MVRHEVGGRRSQPIPSGTRGRSHISLDGVFRYYLERSWSDVPQHYPAAIFILMNPSVASGELDDPTSAWCCEWAKRQGFFRVVLLNVCAYRATDPRELRSASDPCGPENHRWIAHTCRNQSGPIVLGYGQLHRDLVTHEMRLLELLHAEGHADRIHVLRLARDLRPWHPLYLPRSTALRPVTTYARILTHRRRPIRQPYYVEKEQVV